MIERYDLLLCLQGDSESDSTLEFGVRLAGALGRPITVLGIHAAARKDPRVQDQVRRAGEKLAASGLEFTEEHAHGGLAEVVTTYTTGHPYFTLFNAPPRTSVERLVRGGRFHHMLASVRGPMMRVAGVCWPITRMLVSTGGLRYADPLESLAIDFAHRVGSALTFLHVVPPVTLEYKLAQEMAHHWQDLLETDTPQAQHLRASLQAAKEAGVQADLRLRHGQVVDEILEELNQGEYNLIAMGSPYASQSLTRLYRPNVTAAVARAVSCPLLTIHV